MSVVCEIEFCRWHSMLFVSTCMHVVNGQLVIRPSANRANKHRCALLMLWCRWCWYFERAGGAFGADVSVDATCVCPWSGCRLWWLLDRQNAILKYISNNSNSWRICQVVQIKQMNNYWAYTYTYFELRWGSTRHVGIVGRLAVLFVRCCGWLVVGLMQGWKVYEVLIV